MDASAMKVIPPASLPSFLQFATVIVNEIPVLVEYFFSFHHPVG